MTHIPTDLNDVQVIDIDSYEGFIPTGHHFVVFDLGRPETVFVLMGFDEVGLFDTDYDSPTYGFLPRT